MELHRLLVRLGLDDSELQKGLKRSEGSVQSFAQNAAKMARQLTVVAAAATAATVAVGEFAEKGGKSLTIIQGFERQVPNATKALEGMQRATHGLLGETQLLTSFNRALRLGAVDATQEFERLAEGAIVLGRSMGVDATQAIESFSLGIGRQSRLLLDNLGIIVDVDGANRRMAESLGKTTSELTDAERAAAFSEEAFRQLTAAQEELGGVVLNAGDAWTQLKVEVGDTVDALARMTAQSATVQTFFQDMARAVRQLRSEYEELNAERVAFLETGMDNPSVEELQDRALNISGRSAGGATQFGPSGGSVASRLSDELTEARQRMEELGFAGEESFDKMIEGVREFEAEMSMLEFQLGLRRPGTPRALSGFEARTGVSPVERRGVEGFRRTEFATALSDAAENVQAFSGTADDASKGLGGLVDAFTGGAGAQFDASSFAANLGANLASSGIQAVVGQFANALFGPQYETILQENTRALREMTDSLRGELGTGSDVGDALLNAFFSEAAADMGRRQRFSAEMELARLRGEATDAGPGAQFSALQDVLARNLGSGLSEQVAALTTDSVDEFFLSLLDQIQAGTLDPEALGALTVDQLLDVVGEMEGLADAAGGAANELAGLANVINQPQGFKVALHRFRSTDVGGGGIDGGPFVGTGGGGDVVFQGGVTINAGTGDDGRVLYERFARELRMRVARGGSDEFFESGTGRF